MHRIAWLLGAIALAGATHAQDGNTRFDEPGVYLGAQLGGRGYQNACEPAALDCERRDGGWGAFAGYRFNRFIGVETGYLDLGEARATYPRVTSTLEVTGDIEGYDLSILVGVPANENLRFYLRTGGFFWQAGTASREFEFESEGWSASAGAGFEWYAARDLMLRGQYLYLDDLGDANTGGTNAHYVSVGISYFIRTRR